MSGLSLDDRALALGHVAEQIGGIHYLGANLEKFCVCLLADFLPSVAALTKIVAPFKEWVITLREGNEVSPIFGILYIGDRDAPDVLPLIEAFFAFKDGAALERAFVQPAPDLVM